MGETNLETLEKNPRQKLVGGGEFTLGPKLEDPSYNGPQSYFNGQGTGWIWSLSKRHKVSKVKIFERINLYKVPKTKKQALIFSIKNNPSGLRKSLKNGGGFLTLGQLTPND